MQVRLLVGLGLCLVSAASLRAAAPVNDNFNNALELIGASVSATGSNAGATKEVGEPVHGESPGGKSVWWKWTAPGNGSVIIKTAGSSFDTLLSAYTGSSLATLVSVGSDDDSGSSKNSTVGFNVTAGTVYHIAVDGYLDPSGAASGNIALALAYRDQPLQRPANDNFAQRAALHGTVVNVTASNFFASKEPLEPNHAEEIGGASIWWKWTAPVAGPVVISTAGSTVDTLLGVYTGSALSNLVLVARSDDVSTDDPTSLVSFDALPGKDYQIAVDGYDGEPGDINLHIHMNLVWLSAPRLAAPTGVEVDLTGPSGKLYLLEFSSDLRTWAQVATQGNTNGLVPFVDPASRDGTRRFYRARQAQ
jgi:hypothetical protein